MSELAAVIAGEGGASAGSADAAEGVAEQQGGGEGQQQDGGQSGGGGEKPWFDALAAEAPEKGALSDRAWAENKKYQDIPTLVRAHRELEKQFLGGDKIVLPKDGATQEELDAFYSKIGRPEAPDKYEIKAPEGKTIDEKLVERFRDVAFKSGLPATMAAPLVEMFNEHVAETLEAQDAAKKAAAKEGVAAIRKEWGASSPQNMAAANRAMTALGLSGDDVDAIADALPPEMDDGGAVKRNGTARMLDLLRKLGAGMGEDVLGGGGGPKKFGMSPAVAQAKLDAISADPAQVKKLEAKDPALTVTRQRLIEIVAAGEDAENARG